MNESLDYWNKTVAMLQNNWALIDKQMDGAAAVSFVNDASGLFDSLRSNTKKKLNPDCFETDLKDLLKKWEQKDLLLRQIRLFKLCGILMNHYILRGQIGNKVVR